MKVFEFMLIQIIDHNFVFIDGPFNKNIIKLNSGMVKLNLEKLANSIVYLQAYIPLGIT